MDESVYGILEQRFCGGDERTGVVSTLREGLSSGALWNVFVEELLGFEDSDWARNDVAPMKELFAQIVNKVLPEGTNA